MKQKISVIVPVYNVEKYIRKSLDSILNQSYSNLEIILVDDGSLDNSGTICDEYASKDARIKVIHKENGGLSDARNAGVQVATGELIGFIDSDDFIASEMYECMEQTLREKNADIVVCNFETVDECGSPIAERNVNLPVKDEVISSREAIYRLSGPDYTYWTTAWNRLYKKSVVCNVEFPVGKIHEDEYTAHLFYDNCKKIAGVPQSYYKYVVRENSIMTKKYGKKNLDYFEALNNRIMYCVDEDMGDLAAQFTKWMLQKLLIVYPLLDKKSTEMMMRYEQCVKNYLKTYKQVKVKYKMSIVAVVGTKLLQISPRFASFILNRITK